MSEYQLRTNDGQFEFESVPGLRAFLKQNWPDHVMFTDDGHAVATVQDVEIATAHDRRVLVWANRRESENDDGARAVAVLTRSGA